MSFSRELHEPPVPMDPGVMDALRAAAAGQGERAGELASGGGHDTGILAAAGVPCGMLFIRSERGGISHSPAEHREPEAVRTGFTVLARALIALAAQPGDGNEPDAWTPTLDA